MQVNAYSSNQNINPNFGIAYKEFPRGEFRCLAGEFEGRVGIHCLKSSDNVKVVFATVPGSLDEEYYIGKYGAEPIKPLQAREILDKVVNIVRDNFGRLISEVEPSILETKPRANQERTPLSKSRIRDFLDPKKS